MSCISLNVLSVALAVAQLAASTAQEEPLTFAETAETAIFHATPFMAELGVTPGLEMFDRAEDSPELKAFPDKLIKALCSQDAEARSAALKYLTGLAWFVRISAWWRDRDEKDDLFAVTLGRHVSLIRMGLETAIKNTKGNDRLLAAVAILALATDHQAALECVMAELRSADASRRQIACEWTGRVRLSHTQLVTALAKATSDPDFKVRSAAAAALLLIGPRAASDSPAVLVYLKSRETTDAALQEMPLISMFGAPEINRQCLKIGQLLADLKPAVPSVLEVMEGGNANKRRIGFACLAQLGPDARAALKALQPFLCDQNTEIRLTAAATILRIDFEHAGATKELVALLKCEDEKLRARAVEACGELGPKAKALVPLLTAALKDFPMDAAQALGEMGSLAEPAIPQLANLLIGQHGDPAHAVMGRFVQREAAFALVRIGKEGLRVLLDQLAKPSPKGNDSYYAAIYLALGSCKNPDATMVSILIRGLEDESPLVRLNAAISLGRLKRLAAPARDALVRESRCADGENCLGRFERRVVAGWALTQLTR